MIIVRSYWSIGESLRGVVSDVPSDWGYIYSVSSSYLSARQKDFKDLNILNQYNGKLAPFDFSLGMY
jgi:hypothetical protein